MEGIASNFFNGYSGRNCSRNFDGARVSRLYGFYAFNSDMSWLDGGLKAVPLGK